MSENVLLPEIISIAGVVTDFALVLVRVQRYMDSEVMAIMSQYMPLEGQNGERLPLREEAQVEHA